MPRYHITFTIAREYADDDHARASARLLSKAVLSRDPQTELVAATRILREDDGADVTDPPTGRRSSRGPLADAHVPFPPPPRRR